jgi:hypothetical protein
LNAPLFYVVDGFRFVGGSGVKVDRDTLNAGVSSYDLSKAIYGCARTIAAAVELLLLTHPHAAIARCGARSNSCAR